MENYIRKATKETPEILINFDEGIFSFKGRTFSEDSVSFFAPIFKEAAEYFKNPLPKTTFILSFEYLNSSSLKLIIDLLLYAKVMSTVENKIFVQWHFESDDEDILLLGQESERLTGLPFEYISY